MTTAALFVDFVTFFTVSHFNSTM